MDKKQTYMEIVFLFPEQMAWSLYYEAQQIHSYNFKPGRVMLKSRPWTCRRRKNPQLWNPLPQF